MDYSFCKHTFHLTYFQVPIMFYLKPKSDGEQQTVWPAGTMTCNYELFKVVTTTMIIKFKEMHVKHFSQLS